MALSFHLNRQKGKFHSQLVKLMDFSLHLSTCPTLIPPVVSAQLDQSKKLKFQKHVFTNLGKTWHVTNNIRQKRPQTGAKVVMRIRFAPFPCGNHAELFVWFGRSSRKLWSQKGVFTFCSGWVKMLLESASFSTTSSALILHFPIQDLKLSSYVIKFRRQSCIWVSIDGCDCY